MTRVKRISIVLINPITIYLHIIEKVVFFNYFYGGYTLNMSYFVHLYKILNQIDLSNLFFKKNNKFEQNCVTIVLIYGIIKHIQVLI